MERLDMTDYSRQREIDEELRFSQVTKDSALITVIGCGGIGFWVGIFYAMMGFKNFMFVDGESLELSNIARIPVPQTWVGINKCIALRKIIHQMRPGCNIRILPTHYSDDTASNIETFMRGTAGHRVWILDTTDDARTQRKIHTQFKTREYITYLKLGYEGFKIGNYRNMDVWINEETYQPGYRTSMANVITSAISAGLGIFSNSLRTDYHTGNRDASDFNLNLYDLLKGETNE